MEGDAGGGQARQGLLRALLANYEPLRRFAERRMRSRDLATDVVQEAFLRIATVDEHASIDNPLSFLYRVTGNLSLDWLREREVRERHVDAGELPEDVADSSPDGEAVLQSRQRLEILAAAVAELPPRCGEVFRLRKIEHLSTQQIAERLDISRNMVEKHLRKALLHCQARLEQAEAS